jgi:hypothetical protein
MSLFNKTEYPLYKTISSQNVWREFKKLNFGLYKNDKNKSNYTLDLILSNSEAPITQFSNPFSKNAIDRLFLVEEFIPFLIFHCKKRGLDATNYEKLLYFAEIGYKTTIQNAYRKNVSYLDLTQKLCIDIKSQNVDEEWKTFLESLTVDSFEELNIIENIGKNEFASNAHFISSYIKIPTIQLFNFNYIFPILIDLQNIFSLNSIYDTIFMTRVAAHLNPVELIRIMDQHNFPYGKLNSVLDKLYENQNDFPVEKSFKKEIPTFEELIDNGINKEENVILYSFQNQSKNITYVVYNNFSSRICISQDELNISGNTDITYHVDYVRKQLDLSQYQDCQVYVINKQNQSFNFYKNLSMIYSQIEKYVNTHETNKGLPYLDFIKRVNISVEWDKIKKSFQDSLGSSWNIFNSGSSFFQRIVKENFGSDRERWFLNLANIFSTKQPSPHAELNFYFLQDVRLTSKSDHKILNTNSYFSNRDSVFYTKSPLATLFCLLHFLNKKKIKNKVDIKIGDIVKLFKVDRDCISAQIEYPYEVINIHKKQFLEKYDSLMLLLDPKNKQEYLVKESCLKVVESRNLDTPKNSDSLKEKYFYTIPNFGFTISASDGVKIHNSANPYKKVFMDFNDQSIDTIQPETKAVEPPLKEKETDHKKKIESSNFFLKKYVRRGKLK